MRKLQRIGLMLVVVIAIAAPAVAHNRSASITPAIDLRYEIAASNRVQSLPLFAGVSVFDEVARVEVPPSIADELARRFAAGDAEAHAQQGVFNFAANEKVASWPLGVFAANNVNETRELSLDLRRTEGNFRNRWYDPATGSWLTPDSRSYSAGSSNLYAGFNNDPVNNSDPDGNEPITAAIVLGYLGWTTLNTVIDTGIDYGFHAWLGEGDFELGKSFGTNFAVNLATGGIGGKFAKARHLKSIANPLLRRASAEGVEYYAADVAVTGTIEKFAYDQSYGEAYGSAAVGGAVGRGLGYGLQAIGRSRSRAVMRERVRSNIEASKAARRDSGYAEYSRRATAFSFYQEAGWANAKIFEHMEGIDFSHDVRVETLQLGRHLDAWTLPQWGTGNYFSDALSSPTYLGINPKGRVLEQFRVGTPTRALRSRAAGMVDSWTPGGPLQTEGTAIQFFVNDRSGLLGPW